MKLIKLPILWMSEEQAELSNLGLDLEFEPDIKDVYFLNIDAFYDSGFGNTIVVSNGSEYECNMSLEDFIKYINNGSNNE